MPPLDERLKQIIGEVCEEHVQRDGTCRSALRHPSTDEAGQGAVLPALAPGISRAQTEVAHLVDGLVCLCDHWGGRALSVIKQSIEQQSMSKQLEKQPKKPKPPKLDKPTKTYRYRIYPTQKQLLILSKWLGVCCEVYNAALDERKSAYRLAGISLAYTHL